jgi:hypothetical protein
MHIFRREVDWEKGEHGWEIWQKLCANQLIFVHLQHAI